MTDARKKGVSKMALKNKPKKNNVLRIISGNCSEAKTICFDKASEKRSGCAETVDYPSARFIRGRFLASRIADEEAMLFACVE
jgi:hypothetical protein